MQSNSRTAYQDAFDTANKNGAVQGRKRQLKGDSLWRQGIFLGKSVASNEFLFGTEDGVYSGRGVRRLAAAQRANKELFDKFPQGAKEAGDLTWRSRSTATDGHGRGERAGDTRHGHSSNAGGNQRGTKHPEGTSGRSSGREAQEEAHNGGGSPGPPSRAGCRGREHCGEIGL